MADLYSQVFRGDTSTNYTFGANKKAVTPGNGIAGRTVIVSVAGGGGNVSQTELDKTIEGIQCGDEAGNSGAAVTGTTDSFTVVGVSGTIGAGTMYLALQGTGTVSTGAGDYYTGVTVGGTTINFDGLQATA